MVASESVVLVPVGLCMHSNVWECIMLV